ncbi:hypothetical protein [Campylobacter sp. 19-13652]|uniref:hypothetical protein n=1 Tax=Campylobacter sp. 19-13652 TaxID=2840180 RepID=UPI001C84F910|nr:hypothetical protein [Campylobacter sp. 19-13652]
MADSIENRLEKYDSKKFLIPCFNKELASSIQECFGDKCQTRNIVIYPILHY